MSVTIYHNNACSNSRGALALIREAGIEPVVIDYLQEPPSKAVLKELVAKAGLTARGAMRTKDALYAELGLDDESLSEDQLLESMVGNPKLINRPLVVTAKGVRLARPPEIVKEIL